MPISCPICGTCHILLAHELPIHPASLFAPCSECNTDSYEKDRPPDHPPGLSCCCGRRFIDVVMADLYGILLRASKISGDQPLSSVGIPLICPGVYSRNPPFLPKRSLLLISEQFDPKTAEDAYGLITEISGILVQSQRVPGVGDISSDNTFKDVELSLLCGCDVRADRFLTGSGPVLIYKMQRATHIEFPKGLDPKIQSLLSHFTKLKPDIVVDLCSGAGTLGLAAACLGAREVILNDIWYASAFFSAFNLMVNQEILGIQEVLFHSRLEDMAKEKVRFEPHLIAEAIGPKIKISVYHGSFIHLPQFIPDGVRLMVFDPFNKQRYIQDPSEISEIEHLFRGEVFIP